MAGALLRVSLHDAGLKKATDGLLDAATNLRPLMQIAGAIFENSTLERFNNEHGPDGIPWPQSWRARETGGKTLTDKGLLRGSIISVVGDREVETGVDARSESAKYAWTHQAGAVIRPVAGSAPDFVGPSRGGRKVRGSGPARDHRVARKALMFTGPDGKFYMAQKVTIPARPFMGIDADDIRDLGEAFADYLEGAADDRPNGNPRPPARP